MSLPLKLLNLDTKTTIVDAKQKRFELNVESSLAYFDSVDEWADYISNLGKLLKALQSWKPQFQNVKYYVPTPYQVSRRLASSLSPTLPAGVHQKTLDVYNFIFEKIGIEVLSAECNIWIPGILPLMAYASISVKAQLIELYENYLVQLDSNVLKVLIRPMIASLLPGIDEENNEHQPMVFKLIETIKERLNDDSLFWQTCFMIIISDKEHRLGGVVWLTRKFPSLNAVPHLMSNQNKNDVEQNVLLESLSDSDLKKRAIDLLLPGTENLLYPEPGLLVRALVSSLDEDNDLLVKRGGLDLLLQRLHLDSPVIQAVIDRSDRASLILACCKVTMNKDMSLNRRVWNWFLGASNKQQGTEIKSRKSESEDNMTNQYFLKYGSDLIVESLLSLIDSEDTAATCFNICISILDRWEIGTYVTPKIFLKLMKCAKLYRENNKVIASARSYFNAIDTNIIWGELFLHFIDNKDFEFLEFILTTFSISEDEEMIVRHMPLLLLSMLALPSQEWESQGNEKDTSYIYNISNLIISYIPERAFLPLIESKIKVKDSQINRKKIIEQISAYYDDIRISYSSQSGDQIGDLSKYIEVQDLSLYIISLSYEILLQSFKNDVYVLEATTCFLSIYEKVPDYNDDKLKQNDYNWHEDLVDTLVKALENDKILKESVFSATTVFTKFLYNKINLLNSIELIKIIVIRLWDCILKPPKQLKAIKCLETLDMYVPSGYIEEQLTRSFMAETDISKKLLVVDLLWKHLNKDNVLITRILELLVDELFEDENPRYLFVANWVLSLNRSGGISRLFEFLIGHLIQFKFLSRDHITEIDDLDCFTYRIQSLTNVLKSNDQKLIQNFSTCTTVLTINDTDGGENLDTYKNSAIRIILKFLELNNNIHVASVRSCLSLLNLLLDGTEDSFKNIVITMLEMSSTYISQGGVEAESIAVSLVNIVFKVLKFSHSNNIKLEIFDDNTTHLKYLDYLVTSVSNMERPLIIGSYIQLLLGSIPYFEKSIFRVVVPLSASIVQCIDKLFSEEEDKDYFLQSIVLLLDGLKMLLTETYYRLTPLEQDNYFAAATAGTDFLQSMVSNVFSNDNNSVAKIQGERNVTIQSFKESVHCCIGLWVWIHETSEVYKNNEDSDLPVINSHTLRDSVLKLVNSLFQLEPLEIIDCIIINRNDSIARSLVSSLEEHQSGMVISSLLYCISNRCSRGSSLQLSINKDLIRLQKPHRSDEKHSSGKALAKNLIDFLIDYIADFHDLVIEDAYLDFITFAKDTVSNTSSYTTVWYSILRLFAVVATRLSKSEYGDQQNIKREISEIFIRYLSNSIYEISNEEKDIKPAYAALNYVVEQLQLIVNEDKAGDKYNNALNIIISAALQKYFKTNSSTDIPDCVLDLALTISKRGSSNKVWKSLINDMFNNDKQFLTINNNEKINEIISIWSRYPDYNTRLISDLLLSVNAKGIALAPALISFNSWNVSEVDMKCLSILRISYLLMVSEKDTHLLSFQPLISFVCQFLTSKESKLRSVCWILLRVLLVKISSNHFNDYWQTLSFYLQSNLQEFYENIQVQADINSNEILQICKTLDLLLTLNFEGFRATNEWIFIIDTINCISKKYPYIALVDKISESDMFKTITEDSFQLPKQSRSLVPVLSGINKCDNYTQLSNFFRQLSYLHYESVYSFKNIDIQVAEKDLLKDIFIE
ncbi:hypothetical protein Kpol_1036p64 [Vanderwaltozyma polyspora DSM 70294]|uniref:Uncharacterized protein n=1 Tax=Vanderwaltozyma polyspora (strain ATCC 22028 / DSM 70294 / BCRC 21397 / CBS 2163 / NBRC 10782 / NRRL Y-8283 / UCD 57-17) TaxID=436907 RepID=A7TEL2_VANPO|nr:uncharacterized protein Kpol_1036p64 [Vanderwaltozyma polyspora DSM 70294]EDO19319.1 hypothetical protein Kpol_1036p64 [Vanderwaltozyma polyspora DSM 70294]